MRDSPDRDVAVFTEALQMPAAERAAYLDRACGDDADLRRKVEALLDSHNQIGNFLEYSPQGLSLPARPGTAAGEKPGDRIGHFKLLQQIGEGGCGIVYMAEQEEPIRRRVALKVIKPGMDSKSVIARFEAERQALALMDHPNIAKFFDAGATESGRPYFVMELVRGVKITDYCDQHSLTTEERLKLFIQVCKAVQHAHQKGIIHRDIKPSNILVTTTTEGLALPVVIDFGIAKATTNQRLTDKTLFTAFEMLIGTPAYMSPEQAELTSVDVDTRTDIYSLGVLLYELLTGSTPFDSGTLLKSGLDEIRRVIREQEPARPSTRLSKLTGADLTTIAHRRKAEPPTLIHIVRGDLDWIAMKALEKDRARRYETANGLALDIERYLANEPISARPPSKIYKFKKAVLRHKLLFFGLGIISLLLIGSLIVVSTSLAKERQARRDAEAASVKSSEVTKFLEHMLNGVGPSVARGRDTAMLREILDETADRLDKELKNQPEVEAELSGVIAHLYAEIGYPAKGEVLARQELAIRSQKYGTNSLQAADSLSLLGMLLGMQQKLTEAEHVRVETLDIRRRQLGDENADTATALDDLAEVYRNQRRLPEAETTARKALQIRRKLFGNESLQVADSLRNLCMIQGADNRWVEAEQTAREVLAIRRKVLGDDNPNVASALADQAWALNALGKFAEAQTAETEALLIQRKFLGDTHPDVPKYLNALGQLLGNRGDLDSAAGVLKAVLSIQRKLLGDENASTLETLTVLGKALQRDGKPSDSVAVWREASAIAKKLWTNEGVEGLYIQRGLGEALEDDAKWPEAETVWRESLVAWRKRGGIEEQQSMYTLRKLGLALEAQHKWPEAEAVQHEALTVSRKKGNEDAEALTDRERLVHVLVIEKNFSEAERLLDEVLTPTFIRQPAAANLLIQRLDLLGRQARWQEAAGDAALALDLHPTDQYRYHTLVGLLAITQNRNAYEQLAKRLFSKFTDPSNPFVAERMAQDGLIFPESGANLELLDKLADVSLALGSDDKNLPYFQAAKAMSTYRLGHFAEAIDWGQRATASSAADATLNGISNGKAKAYAVLAMAQWKLGHPATAREMLAKGNLLAPEVDSSRGTADLGESWVAWLMARVSLNEAAALIQPESTSGTK